MAFYPPISGSKTGIGKESSCMGVKVAKIVPIIEMIAMMGASMTASISRFKRP